MDGIAIVGIGCRFPGGADNPRAFWRLLADGVNAVAEAPADRPGFRTCFDADPARPGRAYSRWGGFLERVDLFDASFFGISPREAVHVDPQHRLLLELLWEACEDAGVPPSKLAGSRTGVFIGISTHDYGDLQTNPAHRGSIDMHTNSGTATSIAANRLSYVYDLRGPSIAIDTACSSSLTAVHLSCQSLRAGECDLAVAGGVQMLLTPELTIGFCKASMLSPDGECRAFDAGANGYVRSEGGGIVLLKPLSAALRDADPIYAVIQSTAVNQDGRTAGMTVPNPRAQQALIEEALGHARLMPRDIQYVEAHGPGTRVGDPIEAMAIAAALTPGRDAGDACAIGSVKTNLGHLEAASGMPGLIKVALALERRMIPASLHFRQANPAIDLPALGLRVVTELEPWPHQERVAIAGVNSFGFGGANAHVVVQEPPRRPVLAGTPVVDRPHLFVLSARSTPALDALARACADELSADDPPSMSDLSFTTGQRRAHHDFRLAVTASRTEDLVGRLHDFVEGAGGPALVSARVAQGGAPRIAFVFSGLGPQWWGMGRQLRESEPVFRRMLERCDEALRPYAGWSLMDEFAADESRSRLAAPEIVQVTNFALQVALADLWASFGITPSAVIGHSGGAMAAMYVAGVYDLEEALHLTFHRSRLQGRPSNPGRMLAIGASYQEIAPLLEGKSERVSLAAVNGPSGITLAGDGETLERIAAALLERQVFAKFLQIAIAYHSPAMEPIREEFLQAVSGLQGRAPRIPCVSDTTGEWTTGIECDAEFWWRAIRQPVLFRDGLRQMLDDGLSHFLEVGPHPVLALSIAECMKEHGTKGVVLASLRRGEDERAVLLRSLGALYTAGWMPNWGAIAEPGARFVRMPLYPWQRERHWFEPAAASGLSHAGLDEQPGAHPLLGVRLRTARPTWQGLIGAGDTSYLRDHLVQGSVVCPGAAYIEMAIAAAAADAPMPVVLRDVEFLKALRLDVDNGTPTQVAFDADGRFEILSSSGTAGASWICHARGTMATTKLTEAPPIDLEALRAGMAGESDTARFYEKMSDRGLTYGPAFRGVLALWSSRGKAVAEIAAASAGDTAAYRLHPALLDAAFQVLVGASYTEPTLAADRRLFLPTGIREVRFYREPGARFHATASLGTVAPETVTGDVRILNDSGQVCLDVVGLTARLVEVGDRRGAASVDQWLYAYRWEPEPLARPAARTESGPLAWSVVGPVPVGSARDALIRKADAAAAGSGWTNYYDGVESRLNEISAAYIVEAFAALGCRLDRGARVSPDAFDGVRAGGWRRSLVDQLCRQLAAAGFLRREGDGWEATGARLRFDAAQLGASLLQDFPNHRLDVELLARAGPRVADVLAGRADGRDVLFTDDGFEFLERFYRESPASAFYNAEVARIVEQLTATASTGRSLRVLEAGAGTWRHDVSAAPCARRAHIALRLQRRVSCVPRIGLEPRSGPTRS